MPPQKVPPYALLLIEHRYILKKNLWGMYSSLCTQVDCENSKNVL